MRKGIMFSFLILVSLSFVFAGSCEDSQTIMKLSSANNAHASIWSGDYTEEICYDELFGFEYKGSNSHVCTGTNRVLSLHNTTNSHASTISDSYYNEEVCFGDLKCVYDKSAGNDCVNSEAVVVARLYRDKNTHVSFASDTNDKTKVCCSDLEVGAYWANAAGDAIDEADFGDTVKLIARGVTPGVMTIKEDDWITGDDPITTVNGISNGNNIIGSWTISASDLHKTNDYGKFYFEIDGERSDPLSISLLGDDDPMNVSIVYPICGAHYDNGGNNVKVVISAKDNDDIIYGEIKIDETVIENFSNGGTTFNYTFTSSGNFQIVVKAINSRGKRSRDISSIMILEKSGGVYVDKDYIAACISKPKDFSNIEGSTVEFDASTTRGVRIVGGELDELIPDDGDVFSWYWNFQPEDYDKEHVDSTNSSAYRFKTNFLQAGDNSATLRVEI